MKTIYLVKETRFYKESNEKVTAVLNAYTSKDNAKEFIEEMVRLNNDLNLTETEYGYQIVPIKLYGYI